MMQRRSGRPVSRPLTVVAVAIALLGSGACRADGARESATTGTSQATATPKGDFGNLTNVCQPGNAKGATAQGVTDTEIHLGTITDFGFTKNSELIDTAAVFTQWCNAAGG